ncbi:hypothetical protein WA026_022364 [Henosepilachna vigintioctopunctata]|uniref:T-box domain-containing protein n=1 Tax=Henosepilachna vigintioctopunctata TaxID=420089 RepID=A0AAW1V6B5_9CUCU
MLLGTMPEEGVHGGLLVPTAKSRATDFSIAAIMSRGFEPSEEDKSEHNDGPPSRLSSPDLEDILEDDDVEVDVEECSDSETSRSTAKPKTLRRSPDALSECGSEPADRDSPDVLSEKPISAKRKVLCNCDELLSVDCHLETKDLWDKFHDLGTEMIITKTGR